MNSAGFKTRIKRAAQNKANQLKNDELNGLAKKTRDLARGIKVIFNIFDTLDNQSLIFDCVLYFEQIVSREHGY